MPSGSKTHATGEGSQAIGSFVVLNDLSYRLNSNDSTRVRILGSQQPERILYGGIIGCYFEDGSGNPYVGFWMKVEWTFDDSSDVARGTGAGADHIFWRLPPGLDIEIDWSW